MKKITSSNRKNNPARSTELAKKRWYAWVQAEEERIRRKIFSAKTEARRAALLKRHYGLDYFQSPPSPFLLRLWVESRGFSRTAENPAEKQFWDYQFQGYTNEISRRLNAHPISHLALDVILGCQRCSDELLRFTKFAKLTKDPHSIIAKNANSRVGIAIARLKKRAEREKALVRDVFGVALGELWPQYAFIAAACDGFFDQILLRVWLDLMRELGRKRPAELSLDSLIEKGLDPPDEGSPSKEALDPLKHIIGIPGMLTDREEKVITHMYSNGKTQQETAKSLNISQPRVQAIHKAAIGKIKKFYKF